MFFVRTFAGVILLAAIIGCAAPPTPTPTARPPTVTLAPTTSPTPEIQSFVEIALFGEGGRGALTAPLGSVVTLTLAVRPSQRTLTRGSGGTPVTFTTEWQNHTLAQMRYCVGSNCLLPDAWQPFAASLDLVVPIDWVGLREHSVTAQFRDARGALLPAGYALSERATRTMPLTGIIDERTPVAARPPAMQTIVARAQDELPVAGKIHVGERPIVGGKAGSRIEIRVRFEAASPRAKVTELRVKLDRLGRCLTPDEMNEARWEPFVAEKIFPVTLALNWSTFKAHVQYRDAAGNHSPVYCGEVALEGSP